MMAIVRSTVQCVALIQSDVGGLQGKTVDLIDDESVDGPGSIRRCERWRDRQCENRHLQNQRPC
jgi:hypothetical protein